MVGIAFEVVGLTTKWLARRDVVWPDDIRIGLEEGIELAGWILVATGLIAAALAAWQRGAPSQIEREATSLRPARSLPRAAGERERGSPPRRGRG